MPKIIALWAAGVPEKNLNATPHLAAAVRGWAIDIGRSTSTSSPSPCDRWSVIPMGWQAAALRSRGDAAWSAAIGGLQLELSRVIQIAGLPGPVIFTPENGVSSHWFFRIIGSFSHFERVTDTTVDLERMRPSVRLSQLTRFWIYTLAEPKKNRSVFGSD